jgi:hypothetical protein
MIAIDSYTENITHAIHAQRAHGEFRMPALHEIWRQYRPAAQALDLSDRFVVVERLLVTADNSLAYIAVCILALSVPELESKHLSDLDRFLDQFQGWGVTYPRSGCSARFLSRLTRP